MGSQGDSRPPLRGGIGYHVKKAAALKAQEKERRKVIFRRKGRDYKRKVRAREKRVKAKKKKRIEQQLQTIETAVVNDFAKQNLEIAEMSPEQRRMLMQILGEKIQAPEMTGDGPYGLQPKPGMVRALIKVARAKFAENAAQYVQKHIDAVRAAYAAGEFDTAATHAEWAMENLSEGGERLIDPPMQKQQSTAPNVLIGVNVGGMKPHA